MRINNNLMAMNTHRQLGIGNANGSKSMEKLSSGFRINRAGDDAAGLSISEKMRGQIRGLNQASRNAQDGISLLQTAEGALSESHAILQRMRELAVQSSNDTNVGIDREAIQNEITQLKSEIDRIAETTEFNTQKLLKGDGTAAKEIGALKLGETGVISQASLSGGKVQAAAGAKMQLSFAAGFTDTDTDLKDKNFTFEFNGQSIKLDIKTVATAETAGANTVAVTEGGKAVTLTLVDNTTDKDFIMGKIKEALESAMAENVNVNAQDYNISLDKSTLSISSKATGSGETISVSGSVGQAGLEAFVGPISHTGSALVTNTEDLSTAAGNPVTINSVAVTFTEVAAGGASGTYDMTTAEGRAELQANLQKDIDATALKGKVTATVGDDGKITLQNTSKDPAQVLTITANTQSALLGLTADASTNVALSGTNAIVGKQTASGTAEVREKATTTIESFTLDNLKDQILSSGIASDNTDYFTVGGDVTKDGAIKFLSGKGLTIGDETIEFYDSRAGKYEGTADFAVDLSLASVSGNTALDAADIEKVVEQIVKQAGNKLQNVTLEAVSDGTNDNHIKITAKEAGIGGNSIEVKDGVDRAATDVVGSKFKASFQIGANQGQSMDISITDMRSEALGMKKVDLSTKEGAQQAITTIQSAIERVSAQRSSLGAVQNRLEHSIKNLDTSAENLQAAESRIRDVDMAKEMMEFTKNNILQQAAQAMLAQANQAPQGVLQLLR